MMARKLLINEAVTEFETPITLVSYSHVTPAAALPTHATGDLIIALAVNNDNNSISTPAGFTFLASFGFTGYRDWFGYKTAASASETVSWTNVDAVTYVILRGWSSIGTQSNSFGSFLSTADLSDAALDATNGTSFVCHLTWAKSTGQTVGFSGDYYTETTDSEIGDFTLSFCYRAGLTSSLPVTTIDYDPGGNATWIARMLEVKA